MAIDEYTAFRARRDAFISRCLLHLLVARVYTLLGCVVPRAPPGTDSLVRLESTRSLLSVFL